MAEIRRRSARTFCAEHLDFYSQKHFIHIECFSSMNFLETVLVRLEISLSFSFPFMDFLFRVQLIWKR